jgi:hypothetical protein
MTPRRLTTTLLAALSAALVASHALRADTSKPDEPKASAPEPGSPRATLVNFFQAFSEGNAGGIRDLTVAGGEDERKLVDSMADVASAIGKARKAAAAKFSVPEKDLKTQVVPPEVLKLLEEKKVDDDTVSFGQQGNMFAVLKKVDGRWKMSIRHLLAVQAGKGQEDLQKNMRQTLDRLAEVTKGIEAGKYGSADEAARAIVESTLHRASEQVEQG